jgi:hypothetical protein
MPDEPILNFEEHRRRRDADPTRVRCARCGKLIPMAAARCPNCGVHFQGEAFQFTHTAEASAGAATLGRRGLIVLAVLAAALALAAILTPPR